MLKLIQNTSHMFHPLSESKIKFSKKKFAYLAWKSCFNKQKKCALFSYLLFELWWDGKTFSFKFDQKAEFKLKNQNLILSFLVLALATYIVSIDSRFEIFDLFRILLLNVVVMTRNRPLEVLFTFFLFLNQKTSLTVKKIHVRKNLSI